MLDNYKDVQPIVYKILKNAIKNDECSHAYLFESGTFYQSQDFIMAFIKSLLCPFNYFNFEKCNNCHQCQMIDSGNFPELKIINPDGLQIKKEQLLSLQDEFSKKPIIGNKKIYLINGAEKLNKAAANSILKFLEEPDNNIIAILLTNNIYEVLGTIRSRCQIISFKNINYFPNLNSSIEKIKYILYSNLDNYEILTKIEEINEKIIKVIEFVNYYEKNHLNTLLFISKLWNDYIKTKEELNHAFEIITLYYKDILNHKLNRKIEIFNDYIDNIEIISQNNSTKEICDKINIIVNLKNKIKYNANANLLMDKLIISLEEV